MIRYPFLPAEWTAEINRVAPGWFERTHERTETFRALGRYEESSAIWSEVKRVYMSLQGFKCGFCERRLENSRFGDIEHDIEHFRPKKVVKRWPTEAIRADRGIDYDFTMGDDADPGYFLLSYHRENYLISCKTCNSALKGNYFPVARQRQTAGDDPRVLSDEGPLLIYPLGAVDTDPEKLIRFDGVLPIPVARRGHARRRAIVTIDLFALDTREVLLQERAETMLVLHVALSSRDHPNPSTEAVASALIDRLVDRRSPHANCARSFHDLWLFDRPRATEFADAALDYLESLA